MQIILTGITQGLGKEIFDLLKKLNIKIVALSRRFLDEQYDYLKFNKHINLIKVDLSNLSQVETILNELEMDDDIIFINNAATIHPIDKIERISDEELIKAVNLNFLTPALIVKKIVLKNAFIVNISTGAAQKAIDNWSLYCATKAGLEMFLNVVSKENVDIVNIDPGVMNTNMQNIIRNSEFKDVAYFKNLKENNQLKSPSEVALFIYEKYIKMRLRI